MKKILKYSLLSLAIALVVIAGVISYFMATFNPNAYKPEIIQAVKDKQQRTLKLDGNIQLTIFPSIGARIENISLSEHRSDKEFAAIESVSISLAVMPLLAKQFIVNEVGLSGVKLSIVKFRDGTSNLDDFLGRGEDVGPTQPPPETQAAIPFRFDIAAIRIENATASYRDERTGAQYAVSNLNLKTGRIANAAPVKVALEAAMQGNKPKLDIATKLHATLTFDLEKNLYQVKGLDMQINGSAIDFVDFQLQASGDASANFTGQEYVANSLVVSASGMKGKDDFSANLNVPSFSFTRDKVMVEKLTANASLNGDLGKITAALGLQEMQGNAQSFKSGGLLLDAEMKQEDQAFKLKISTPLVGSMEAKQINLSNLVVALNASGEKFPNKAISSEMKGSMQLDGGRESMQLNLAGSLLQSQAKIKLAVKNFSGPAIRYDVELDQFDADMYLPKRQTETAAIAKPVPEQPFDLSGLQKLNLDGSLRIGTFKIANVESTKLRIDVKANKGQVNFTTLSANIYEGSMNGSLMVDVAQTIPAFAVKQNLSGVRIGPMIKDAADLDIMQGKGNVSVNFATQGNTVSAIKKGLNGNVALNMADGAIKGINLSKIVHGAQNLQGGGVQMLKPNVDDKTEFSELKASFKVTDGVAHNEDLLVKSQSLKVTGNGDIDIGNSTINYAIKTTLAESVDGKSGSLTVPVQLQGPFADLQFKVDYGAVVTDVIKQKIDAKIESKKDEIKQQLQEKFKGGLKGLLK